MSSFFTLSLSLSFLHTPLLCLSLCFRLVSFFKSIFQFILFLLGLISCLIQSLSFSIIIVSSFSNLLVFFYNILFLMLPILFKDFKHCKNTYFIFCVSIFHCLQFLGREVFKFSLLFTFVQCRLFTCVLCNSEF